MKKSGRKDVHRQHNRLRDQLVQLVQLHMRIREIEDYRLRRLNQRAPIDELNQYSIEIMRLRERRNTMREQLDAL